MTALYAVAGNPVFHSRSPVMFNTAFRERALEAVYLAFAASTPEEIVSTARVWAFKVSTSLPLSKPPLCPILTSLKPTPSA